MPAAAVDRGAPPHLRPLTPPRRRCRGTRFDRQQLTTLVKLHQGSGEGGAAGGAGGLSNDEVRRRGRRSPAAHMSSARGGAARAHEAVRFLRWWRPRASAERRDAPRRAQVSSRIVTRLRRQHLLANAEACGDRAASSFVAPSGPALPRGRPSERAFLPGCARLAFAVGSVGTRASSAPVLRVLGGNTRCARA